MKYLVMISETYTYEQEVECEDEIALQNVLHEQVPLLIDMDKRSLERIREQGLELRSDFEWQECGAKE